MLTGINFSPPLYFLFNFCIQLIFPTSIEQLRIQSLIFIIIGIILSFLITRNLFGNVTAFIATILVASQSNILLSQAQEARHYAMFFACGAWVLYMQSLNEVALRKYWGITFISHFCLCQVHYLGIVFSALIGLSYLISNKEKAIIKKIPFPVISSWIFSIPVYLLLLSQQSSHLGNWPKPNGLSNLISSYNDSILFLTIIIPCLAFIISSNSKRNTVTLPKEETIWLTPVIITSFLWILVPLLFWIISHIAPLNLFVDRYFIPKEAAIIFLVGFGLSLIFQNLPNQKTKIIPILGTMGFSLGLLLVSTKRGDFGLDKNTNYHHSLIIEETYPESEQPVIIEAEPIYFPNAYKNSNDFLFLVKDNQKKELYIQFSKKLNILKY